MHRLVCAGALAASSTAMGGDVVFSTDFEDGAPAQIGGAGAIEGTQGYADHGFGASFWRNTTGGPSGQPGEVTTLTLTDLPAHEAVNLFFDFAAIDSWDNDGGFPGDDHFVIIVDGETVFDQTFSNQGGAQSWKGTPIVGPEHLGFTNGGFYPDSGYVLYVKKLAHEAPALAIEFRATGEGWQGGTDESFAIDNIVVELTDACRADANEDGLLNVLDFVAFQTLWQQGDPCTDCDADGAFSILDFVCFQQAFVTGCP